MQLPSVTPEQVSGWSELIRKDSVGFLAAILFLSTLLFLGLWIRSRQRVEALKDEERARDDEERGRMDRLRDEHKRELLASIAEAQQREREERERNFKLLAVVQSFVKFTEAGALVVRAWDERFDPPPKRSRKARGSGPKEALAAEMPTVSVKLPSGGENGGQ